ncbi:MAG: hypothetical protein IPJ24_17840 [bacterium]|nr:hypothetical protein [bacterium]
MRAPQNVSNELSSQVNHSIASISVASSPGFFSSLFVARTSATSTKPNRPVARNAW